MAVTLLASTSFLVKCQVNLQKAAICYESPIFSEINIK